MRLSVVLTAVLLGLGACRSRPRDLAITVYNPSMRVSLPVPEGWKIQTGREAGFLMQSFTGPAIDAPGRPGLTVQVMAGPMPPGAILDSLSGHYTTGQELLGEQDYSLHGFAGKTWHFSSKDSSQKFRLMLTPIEGTLYSLYAHGERRTFEARQSILDAIWQGLAVEHARFFELYERPEFGVRLKHPPSWKLTNFLGGAGKSFFVGFRSPALAVEASGATVHATLEVTVNAAPSETSLQSFYAKRVEMLGENYRILRHELIRGGRSISDLYGTETQLASYRERTLYFLDGGRSFVFKFNVQAPLYAQIEGWIDDIAATCEPFSRPEASGSP